MYELTLDGLVHLVPELIEPAPPGLPLWDHVLRVDHASTIYSTPVRAKRKFFAVLRILQVKLSYENPLFHKIFHDFHLFLKVIPYKSSLFK